MMLRVLATPPGASLQDPGRPGLRSLGIAPAGALDRESARIANRLVGNHDGAAVIEVPLGGLRLRTETATSIAVTGAEVGITIDDRPVDLWWAHPVAAGEEIALGLATRGARAYVSVVGGFVASTVLGSLSRDTMSGLGPSPLAAGDVLHTGIPHPIPANDIAPWRVAGDDVTLHVRRGPRAAWFTPEAWRTLTSAAWIVTADADRVGIRLDGPDLPRAHAGELPSEGMVVGALQVPPSGRPVILLADGPVTGGYPVIGVIAAADRDALGQLRPGAMLRLRG